MTRYPALVLALVVLAAATAASALDLPVKLGFQLGFHVTVVPSRDDLSGRLGLVVAPYSISTDKRRILVVSGTVTNFSEVTYTGLDMRFAVNSYLGTGVSRGVAALDATTLPPGATTAFSAHITLNSEKPRLAMYTVTACPAGPAD